MKILYWSGSININNMGATKSIDTSLTQCLTDLGHDVTWVARGGYPDASCNYFDIGNSKLFDYYMRILNRIKRTFLIGNYKEEAFNEYLKYDHRMAKLIKSGLVSVDHDTVFIGRNAMSLCSMKEIQKRGGKTIIHSQFVHPEVQDELVSSSFKNLGIPGRAVLKKRSLRQIEELKLADAIWCISSLVTKSYLKYSYTKDKLFYCPLGVDNYYYSSLSDNSSEIFTIIFVGNINPEKGAHILMEALLKSDLKKCKLIFNGVIASYFKSIFDKYYEQLIAKGYFIEVSPGPPLENYRKSNLFILPSVHDSFGLVVLEAMAVGLPVIVSSNVGAKDCIKDKKNGYIFNSGSVVELKNYIEKLYHNPAILKEMSSKSLELSAEYQWNEISKKLILESEKLLTKKHHK